MNNEKIHSIYQDFKTVWNNTKTIDETYTAESDGVYIIDTGIFNLKYNYKISINDADVFTENSKCENTTKKFFKNISLKKNDVLTVYLYGNPVVMDDSAAYRGTIYINIINISE